MTTHNIIRQIKRGSRYEVWASIYDDEDNLIIGSDIFNVGAKELDEKELDIFFKNKIYPMFEQNQEEKDTFILISEVEAILREKGYLLENEKFNDLGVKNG